MKLDDLQAVADLASDYLKLHNPPKVVIKDIRRGWCHGNYVVIPQFAEKYSEAYQIYYAVHEVIHCVVSGHGPRFKAVERAILALWDIIPTYAKAYPKYLHNAAGQELHKSWREKRKEQKRVTQTIQMTPIV